MQLDPKVALSRITRKKAKGAEELEGRRPTATAISVDKQEFETCFEEYEKALKASNLLDYDDLLLRCADLLRRHPGCVSNVEAVLIDEFQDTNLVQFDLMRLFAAQRRMLVSISLCISAKCGVADCSRIRVTIVGDPDQSIYGFRSAEVKNFNRMLVQYPETTTISLEENYRSSGAILLLALEVIQQDNARLPKSLLATHTVGTMPVLRKLSSAPQEAEWIVREIRRIMCLTGNLIAPDDVAILLRSAVLSRHIETAMGKAGIAYKMAGGRKFYDRAEIKTLLDYMRAISQVSILALIDA